MDTHTKDKLLLLSHLTDVPSKRTEPSGSGCGQREPGTMKTPRMLVPKHPAQWTELGTQEQLTAPLPLSSPHSVKAGQLGASLEHPWEPKRLLLPSHRSSSTQAVNYQRCSPLCHLVARSGNCSFPTGQPPSKAWGYLPPAVLANISPLPKE